MRLDLYLVSAGLAPTRQRAQALIREGLVTLDGRVETRPSANADGKEALVTGEGLRYVGRGGLKLERALEAFGLSPAGAVCLDLGASTGGFTDCLLQNGAKKVYALDVGHGQLAPKLRDDPRVTSLEGYNARDLDPVTFSEAIDLAVSDLSFISQRLIYAPLRSVLREGAPFVSLVKPQFEAGRKDVGKNGIVKDRSVHERVVFELIEEARRAGFGLRGFCPSPISGGDGNREYLALFAAGRDGILTPRAIREAIYE